MPSRHTSRTIKQVAIEQAAIGQTDLVAAPGVGLRVYIVGVYLQVSAAGTVTFNEGAGPTALSGVIALPANGSFNLFSGENDVPVLETQTANAKFGLVTTGVGATAHGWLRYFIAET